MVLCLVWKPLMRKSVSSDDIFGNCLRQPILEGHVRFRRKLNKSAQTCL
jgi:hypothetical protein